MTIVKRVVSVTSPHRQSQISALFYSALCAMLNAESTYMKAHLAQTYTAFRFMQKNLGRVRLWQIRGMNKIGNKRGMYVDIQPITAR